MKEEQRYTAIQEQMKALLDAAARDPNPATNMLRAMLYAELYERNETTRQRVIDARVDFVQTLLAIIAQKTEHDRRLR